MSASFLFRLSRKTVPAAAFLSVAGFIAGLAVLSPAMASAPEGAAAEAAPKPAPARPLLENGRAEAELGAQFDTSVARSHVDRAGRSEVTRDRLGEGALGVFYDHEADHRLQDTHDRIGVDLKIIEFR